jgi:hypothetical protein
MAVVVKLLAPRGRGQSWLGNLFPSNSWRGDAELCSARAYGSLPLTQLRLTRFAPKAAYPSPPRGEEL